MRIRRPYVPSTVAPAPYYVAGSTDDYTLFSAYTATGANVILPLGYWDSGSYVEESKHYCDYCKGHTFDDARGNCAACGGPREE